VFLTGFLPGTNHRYAPKGPRMHAMSPPLQDRKPVGRSIPQPAKIAKWLRRRFGDPDPVFRPLSPQKPSRDPSIGQVLDHNTNGHHFSVRWCPFVSHFGRLVSHFVSLHGKMESHPGRMVSHFVSHLRKLVSHPGQNSVPSWQNGVPSSPS
jgi:hypothetical protein